MSQPSSSSRTLADEHEHRGEPAWLGKTIGRFELLGLLGRGAYGRVFLAEDRDLRRRVALKVVTADAARNAVRRNVAEQTDASPVDEASAADFGRHAVEQMAREGRIAAKLEHPNITTIYEVGVVPGRDGEPHGSFIAMELADGGTLQELVNAAGPLKVGRACRLVAEAAEALQFAHDSGVLHRDVKPGNLMLGRTGRCKLADFGLAYADESEDGHHYARLVGTPAYAAPEIVLGEPATPASDQYSLGCTLFCLLVGRPPYVGKRSAVLDAHVTKPVADPLPARPELDPDLAALIRRAMAKKPADRFESVGQFGAALRTFAADAGEPLATHGPDDSMPGVSPLRAAAATTAADEPPSEESTTALASIIDQANRRRRDRRRRRNRLLAVAATVVLLGGGAWGAFLWMRDFSARPSVSIAPPTGGAITHDRPSGSASPPALDDRARTAASVSPPERPRFDAAGGEVVSALDYDRLLEFAQTGATVTVGGTVSYARTSNTGEVFRVYFEGNEQGRAFALIWFADGGLFERMQQAFGGTNGSGLLRERIEATGELSIHNGRPQLIVTDPGQIEIQPSDTRSP